MQESLMQQGIELMGFGMGTVFIFLTVLVVATTFMSAMVQRYGPPEPKPQLVSKSISADQQPEDEQVVAVISAAIHKYRSRRK